MRFKMDQIPAAARYKLLTATITPRPIAWVTTMSGNGVINVAPFSCFNLMGHTPPTVVLGIEPRVDGSAKDTLANVEGGSEMVINLVRRLDVESMLATAADVPPDVDEAALAGIEMMASDYVAPPRIATAPVSLECRTLQIVDVGPAQKIIIAEIVMAHIRDDCVVDDGQWHVDTPALDLVGRMHGPGWFVRCDDPFQYTPTR